MGEHTVVLVTGSMRSGTSSLAGSLKLLGWHVPQPEVPASERNAKGHFEPRWVIEFHKRLLRRALVRPSDGSPSAEQRVNDVLEDGRLESELRDWLAAQAEPQVVVKDPHASWVLPPVAPRRRAGRPGPAHPHRAPPPGRGGRLAGPHLGQGPAHRRRAPGQGDLQHRRLAQRRAGHRGGFAGRAAGVHPVRRPAGRLARRARPGVRPARPRAAARRGARRRRVPRSRDAPLRAGLGRHRAAGLAARPGREHLAAARDPGRRPRGGRGARPPWTSSASGTTPTTPRRSP